MIISYESGFWILVALTLMLLSLTVYLATLLRFYQKEREQTMAQIDQIIARDDALEQHEKEERIRWKKTHPWAEVEDE